MHFEPRRGIHGAVWDLGVGRGGGRSSSSHRSAQLLLRLIPVKTSQCRGEPPLAGCSLQQPCGAVRCGVVREGLSGSCTQMCAPFPGAGAGCDNTSAYLPRAPKLSPRPTPHRGRGISHGIHLNRLLQCCCVYHRLSEIRPHICSVPMLFRLSLFV